MKKLNKQYKPGDIVKIKSPINNHVHNDYCNCGMIVLLLEPHKDPNMHLKYKNVMKKLISNQITRKDYPVWFDPKETWTVYNSKKGFMPLTESWMIKLST